jgi:transposase-like protein
MFLYRVLQPRPRRRCVRDCPSPKNYIAEFRQQTADYVILTGRSVKQMARKLDINDKTLSNWVTKRKQELSGAAAKDKALREAKKHIRDRKMENEFLKKAATFFCEKPSVSEKYALIYAEKANYPITMMARLLGVTRSGYYAWAARGDPREDLKEEIMRIWEKSKQRFGARMIWASLPCAFSSVSL